MKQEIHIISNSSEKMIKEELDRLVKEAIIQQIVPLSKTTFLVLIQKK